MSARTRELLGLIPVSLIVTAGFTAVLITRSNEIDTATLTYGAFFLGACVFGHLFIRARLPDADPYLFPLAAALAGFGLVMIYRIEPELAREQAQWFVFGLALFCGTIVLLRDYRVLERYRYLIAVGAIGLLLMPRLPGIGATANGAYLAIDLGPLAFQPAEFAKIAIVVFLASYLNDTRDVLVQGRAQISMKHLGPLLVVWGGAMLMLVLIRDLGSSLMFFGGFLALVYVATSRKSLVLGGLALFAAGAYLFGNTVSHVRDRVDIWLDPFSKSSQLKGGGQISQSLFAQADGGLFGKGFGESLLKLPGCARDDLADFPNKCSILPAPHTDFIYAVIVNEVGLFGAAAVVVTCLLFVARGFKTAELATDGFSKLLATGLAAVFALQVFVIIGGVTKVIPLTGVTLPFISYGGSSILANFILLALLLIVSDRSRRDPGAVRGGLV